MKYIIFRPEFMDVHAGAGLYLNVEDVLVPDPDDAVLPNHSTVPAADHEPTRKDRAWAARDGGIWIPVPEPHTAMTRAPSKDGQGLVIVPDATGACGNEVVRAIFAYLREHADAITSALDLSDMTVGPYTDNVYLKGEGGARTCGHCAHFVSIPTFPNPRKGCAVIEYSAGPQENHKATETWFDAMWDAKQQSLSCAAEDCPGFTAKARP